VIPYAGELAAEEDQGSAYWAKTETRCYLLGSHGMVHHLVGLVLGMSIGRSRVPAMGMMLDLDSSRAVAIEHPQAAAAVAGWELTLVEVACNVVGCVRDVRGRVRWCGVVYEAVFMR
jgi:hypothetical protein